MSSPAVIACSLARVLFNIRIFNLYHYITVAQSTCHWLGIARLIWVLIDSVTFPALKAALCGKMMTSVAFSNVPVNWLSAVTDWDIWLSAHLDRQVWQFPWVTHTCRGSQAVSLIAGMRWIFLFSISGNITPEIWRVSWLAESDVCVYFTV